MPIKIWSLIWQLFWTLPVSKQLRPLSSGFLNATGSWALLGDWVTALAVLCLLTTTYSAWAWVPNKKSFLSPVWRWAADRWQRCLKFNPIGKGHWHYSWLFSQGHVHVIVVSSVRMILVHDLVNSLLIALAWWSFVLSTQDLVWTSQWHAISPVGEKKNT